MEYLQFIIDYQKYLFSALAIKFSPRLKTSIIIVFQMLKFRGYLKENSTVIELFGMHGLWHTKYYFDYIAHLDIFEINQRYHKLSKLCLDRSKAEFFHQDSLAYASKTEKKYDIVVSDTPMSVRFYEASGLPVFWETLIRVAEKNAIIIFNIYTTKMFHGEHFSRTISGNLHGRKLLDMFYVPRNETISYCVIVLD
jgi:hypothetical protein